MRKEIRNNKKNVSRNKDEGETRIEKKVFMTDRDEQRGWDRWTGDYCK